jgi:homoserine dehydrogenase
MTGIAILGFGVVGSGVAGLIRDNYSRVAALGGDGVEIKYILDFCFAIGYNSKANYRNADI